MEKKNKIVICFTTFLIVCGLVFLIPAVQSFLLQIGTFFLGRTLRNPNKWILKIRTTSLMFIGIGIFLPLLIYVWNNKRKELSSFYYQTKSITDNLVVFIFFAIIIFFYIFRCTESSLWYDEGIEYWVSKSLTGVAYGNGIKNLPNMYERICATIQPPLYNFFMFVWLKIADTEFWFKFFGIVCFILGNFAFYCLCREVSSKLPSAVATIAFALSGTFISYAHEAAEYTCLFCFICWMMLFFFKSIKKFTWKNIVLYFVFATLSIYSQYGACFIILGTGAILFLRLFFVQNSETRNKNLIKFFACSVPTVLFFVLPLFILFMKRQLFGHISSQEHIFTLEHSNIVIDYLLGFLSTASFFFNKFLVILICFMSFSVFVISLLAKKKDEHLYYYTLAAVFISWTAYYFAVRFDIYKTSYTFGFGNRWGMSFCALLGFYFAFSVFKFYEIISAKENTKRITKCLVVIFSLFICLYSIRNAIKFHSVKSYVREAYNYLKENDDFEDFIFVEKWYQPTFAFYLEHDSDMDFKNLFYLKSHSEHESTLNIKNEFSQIFENGYPPKFILFCGDEPTNYDTTITVLDELGYYKTKQIQFDESEFGDPTLLYFSKKKDGKL